MTINDLGGQLRIGIHAGEVGKVDDVNGQRNVFGVAINMAQRVMDAANEGQCLISEAAWDPCVGGETVAGAWFEVSETGEVVTAGQPLQARVGKELHSVMIKHGRHAAVRAVDLVWRGQALTIEAPPRSKDQTILEFTPLPKNARFLRDAMAGARQIALVQLTGAEVLPQLRTLALASDLQALWVFMPGTDVMAQMAAHLPVQAGAGHDGLVGQWREVLAAVQASHPAADIHLGVLDALPFFGASMLDWDQPSGRLHVSPYLWGVAPADTPGFDIAWSDARQPAVAKSYIAALRHLRALTSNPAAAGR